jgi:lipooligosaccharide transport system permease protein
MRLLRVLRRNAMAYRRRWRASLFSSFLQPTLFFVAMGMGLGALVDQGGTDLPGHVRFIQFLAPGLLAGACMQTAAMECTWPISDRIRWSETYSAIVATPLGVVDVVLGELAWIAVRLSMVSTAFLLVMSAFRVAIWPAAALAIPGGVVTGLAFAAPIVAYSAWNRRGDFNKLFRFLITPLFLFSGTFFPVARLPRPLQVVARFTPLYHGVELVRGLVLNTLTRGDAAVHTAYLVGLGVAGVLLANLLLRRRLTP